MVARIEPIRVREERQNFDPSGHYVRPDVIQLTVHRDRQCAVTSKNRCEHTEPGRERR